MNNRISFGKIDEISRKCANDILNFAKELAKTREKIVLALPGGRSVGKIFENFSKSQDPIWKKIHIFVIDERVVEISSNDSNFRLIKEAFADKLISEKILPRENLHPFILRNQKDMGANNYFRHIESFGGKIDIVLLSSGEDGHVAGLFPGHRLMNNEERNYFYFKDSPKLPRARITASKTLIKSSSLCCVIFAGNAKKNALHNFLNEKTSLAKCPAKLASYAKMHNIYTDISAIDLK